MRYFVNIYLQNNGNRYEKWRKIKKGPPVELPDTVKNSVKAMKLVLPDRSNTSDNGKTLTIVEDKAHSFIPENSYYLRHADNFRYYYSGTIVYEPQLPDETPKPLLYIREAGKQYYQGQQKLYNVFDIKNASGKNQREEDLHFPLRTRLWQGKESNEFSVALVKGKDGTWRPRDEPENNIKHDLIFTTLGQTHADTTVPTPRFFPKGWKEHFHAPDEKNILLEAQIRGPYARQECHDTFLSNYAVTTIACSHTYTLSDSVVNKMKARRDVGREIPLVETTADGKVPLHFPPDMEFIALRVTPNKALGAWRDNATYYVAAGKTITEADGTKYFHVQDVFGREYQHQLLQHSLKRLAIPAGTDQRVALNAKGELVPEGLKAIYDMALAASPHEHSHKKAQVMPQNEAELLQAPATPKAARRPAHEGAGKL